MQQISIAVLVVAMMLAIGLRTHASEFVTVGRRPGALLTVLFVNVVVVPALVLFCMLLPYVIARVVGRRPATGDAVE